MAESTVADQRSAEAKQYRRWYQLKVWKAARATQLAHQPLCERCLQDEIVTEATVVNHRLPFKGNWQMFIDPSNHESTCEPHHNSLIQREERRGHVIGCDVDGRPLDPHHPWNR
ncbi:HNH endonuclease [Rhizobium laguerreae]|uniref:HNH endonuclease n=1 Tax=Rhizobium laguerreae TaxID=1076926 RepID=UPI001C907F6E|nr:HNH endonuclease [Rhizobium laguerreae]MBY3386393.1 HNH endonuclease [Rhizobium laguerreae]MBY3400476.1 HNH endonuclease [Rhizobium laguerreae]MBY3407414.1 HNH endonuclease [Rhizobium laguerreae]